MKNSFASHKTSIFGTLNFTNIARLTFIVYFIVAFCGWFNAAVAHFFGKHFFPLRSYLILFDDFQISNLDQIQKGFFNLAGFKAQINTFIPYKIIDDLFFIVTCLILVTLFYYGYKKIDSNEVSILEIIKWSIAFSLLMTLSFPTHSSDLYGYIARGAQQSLYNQNPYLESVSEINNYSTNHLFINFMWPEQPTTYGPLFVYFTKAIVFLSNNSFFSSFINFKFLNLTLYLLLVSLVLRLNNIKNLYLVAWNPLLLIQGLWNCHNDLLSGILIFLGIYLFKKENYFLCVFSLMLAAGVKYVSLLIIPIIFFYCLKKVYNKGAFLNLTLGLCCGVILIIIFSLDYLIPTSQFSTKDICSSLNKLITNINLVHKSFIALIFTLIKYFCSLTNIDCNLLSIQYFLKYAFYLMFGVFYLWVLVKKKSNLIFDIALVLFIFLTFTIAKFHSWYLLNLIVLIPLIEKGMLQELLIVLSMSHTFAITFLDQAKILNFLSMTLIPILFVLFKEKCKK